MTTLPPNAAELSWTEGSCKGEVQRRQLQILGAFLLGQGSCRKHLRKRRFTRPSVCASQGSEKEQCESKIIFLVLGRVGLMSPSKEIRRMNRPPPKTQLCLLMLICFWMQLLIAFCYQIQRELCHLPASIHASPSLPTYPCALPWLKTKQSRKIEVHHGHGAGAGRSVNSAKFKAVAWGGWRDVHVMKGPAWSGWKEPGEAMKKAVLEMSSYRTVEICWRESETHHPPPFSLTASVSYFSCRFHWWDLLQGQALQLLQEEGQHHTHLLKSSNCPAHPPTCPSNSVSGSLWGDLV